MFDPFHAFNDQSKSNFKFRLPRRHLKLKKLKIFLLRDLFRIFTVHLHPGHPNLTFFEEGQFFPQLNQAVLVKS